MKMDCPYQQTEICIYYENCNSDDYLKCWIYTSLEGMLNREVFKSRINKRIHREEHGHKQHESPPNFNDISLLIR